MTTHQGGLTAVGVHHVGATVSDIPAALAFWEPLLGTKARFVGRLDRPYLGEHVGHPGVEIEAAIIDLPGGGALELLDYRLDGRATNPEDTATIGNVHLCLAVADCEAAFAHRRRLRRARDQAGRADHRRCRAEPRRARDLPARARRHHARALPAAVGGVTMDIADQRVVVTGAGSGIGHATARLPARASA